MGAVHRQAPHQVRVPRQRCRPGRVPWRAHRAQRPLGRHGAARLRLQPPVRRRGSWRHRRLRRDHGWLPRRVRRLRAHLLVG
ncbi:hypothetical protein ACFPRL_11720 [Pseudoclavibacter helvolus]